MTDPRIRANDADRDNIVAELRGHVGAGRLTLDEFSERARDAYRADTLGELAALRADLPAEQPVDRPAPMRRRIPAAAVIAAAVLSFFLGGAVLATGTGAAGADVGPFSSMCH